MPIDMALDASRLVVALIAISGTVKSLYNGYLHRLIGAIGNVDRLGDRVRAVVDHQRRLTDSVVAIGYAVSDEEVEIDPDAIYRELREDSGPGRFFSIPPSGPTGADLGADTEDSTQTATPDQHR